MLVASHLAKRIEQGVAPEVVLFEHAAKRRTALGQQAKQQVLGADILVAQLRRLRLCGVERLLQLGAEVQVGGAGALHLGAPGQLGLEIGLQLGQVHPDSLEQGGDDAVLLPCQGQGEVLAIDLLLRVLMRQFLRRLQRFL